MKSTNVIILMSMAGFGCSQDPVKIDRATTKTVVVRLDRPVSQCEEIEWPRQDDIPDRSITIETSHIATIVLPSSKVWKCHSRLTYCSQKDGVVRQVTVTPLAEAATFENALKLIVAVVKELGIENDAQTNEWMSQRRNSPPEWGPFNTISTAAVVEPGIRLYLEIKPTGNQDEWYLSIDLTVQARFNIDQTKDGSPQVE